MSVSTRFTCHCNLDMLPIVVFTIVILLDSMFLAPGCILERNPLLERLFKYHTSGSYNNVNGKNAAALVIYICSKTKDYEL